MTSPSPLRSEVVVVDVQIPFVSMVTLMVKFVIASIPAFLILGILAAMFAGVIGGVFASLGR